MNSKTCFVIEIEKGDKKFEFSFQHGAPYSDCIEALKETADVIVRLSEAAKEIEDKKAAKESEETEDKSESTSSD